MNLLDHVERHDEWKIKAACRDFTQAQKNAYWDPCQPDMISNTAREICAGCPVREPCLEYAMALEGNAGAGGRWQIFGGLTPVERAKLARQRRSSKPQPVESQRGETATCEGPGCTNRFDPTTSESGNVREKRYGPRRYCEKACAWRALLAARPLTNMRQCGWCEQEFDSMTKRDGTKSRTARLYCSDDCRSNARSKKAEVG